LGNTRPPRIDLYPGRELLAELRGYAEGHSLSLSAAACAALEVGLTALRRSGERERSQADALAAGIDRAETMLHLIGPPLLGLPGLIAHWAVRTGDLFVDEEELLDEFSRHAEALWETELESIEDAAALPSKGE
jgi:hypothetical protein